MAENEDDPEELRRQIDNLRRLFEKSEVERKADKRVQEAEMSALQSSLDKGLAENRAANREALARHEAATKEGLAQNREAIAEAKTAFERLGKDLVKTIMVAVFAVIAAIGVATAVLGVFLQQLQQG